MGWQARLQLHFEHDGQRTLMRRKGSVGPLCVQKPFYPEGDVCHAYLLHPPGVIAGGDRVVFEADVGAGARVLLTTPAATKFLRSNGETAQQEQTLRIDAGGFAEWMPQETIVFNEAIASNQTNVVLDPGSAYIGHEVVSLARPANRERFKHGHFVSTLRINRYCPQQERHRLHFQERQTYAGDSVELDAAWGLAGRPVCGTLIATPTDADALQKVRQVTSEANIEIQSTLVRDVLVVRCAGHSAPPIQDLLRRCWAALRPIMMQRSATYPGIWRT